MKRVVALVSLAALIGLGCASRKAMRAQAVSVATAAEALDDDLTRLDNSLATVHRLRRVRIEGDRLSADRSARETEVLLGSWRLEDDPLSRAKLELFEGVRGASQAAAEHGYGIIDYKLGVERSIPGYTLDRAALRRLVALLLSLARPTTFKGEVSFFIEYGAKVGEKAQAGVAEVVEMTNKPAPESESEPEKAREP